MYSLAARRIGLAAVVVILTTGALCAQNQPFVTLGGGDQPQPEAPLLPAAGLTLEAPGPRDFGQGTIEPRRPSDGLGLQIYGNGALTPLESAGEGMRPPENALPAR